MSKYRKVRPWRAYRSMGKRSCLVWWPRIWTRNTVEPMRTSGTGRDSWDEQSSIPVDQDLLCGLLGSGGVVGPFDECAVLELRAGADERHEMGRVDRPPA